MNNKLTFKEITNILSRVNFASLFDGRNRRSDSEDKKKKEKKKENKKYDKTKRKINDIERKVHSKKQNIDENNSIEDFKMDKQCHTNTNEKLNKMLDEIK